VSRDIYYRDIYYNIYGLFGGLFNRDWGEFGDRGGEGEFSTIRRVSSGRFEAHPGTPVPSAPYCPSFLTTAGTHPGVVGVPIKNWYLIPDCRSTPSAVRREKRAKEAFTGVGFLFGLQPS